MLRKGYGREGLDLASLRLAYRVPVTRGTSHNYSAPTARTVKRTAIFSLQALIVYLPLPSVLLALVQLPIVKGEECVCQTSGSRALL